MFDAMTRWVRRRGRVVELGNIVGGLVGRGYVYKFPSEALAKKFEKLVSGTTDGHPTAVPEEWRKYRVGGSDPFSPRGGANP